jgi:hypothetical protein
LGLVAILLCPALVMAFQGQLMLTGVVADDTGAAVPGATVTVTGPTNAEPHSTTSQQDGRFTFDNLLPASYVLKHHCRRPELAVRRTRQFGGGGEDTAVLREVRVSTVVNK